MQSYKIHVVSEHLKDRYPYLELPFNDRLDYTEVNIFLTQIKLKKLIKKTKI